MKYPLDEIKASYTAEKRKWDFAYPWIYFFVRPASFWLTWFLLPFGISANQATLLSLVVGLLSCISFAFGYEMGFYIGTFLLILFNVMDCVDGNIARIRGTTGPVGRYYDGLVGNIHVLVYLFIGLGLYFTPDRSLNNFGFERILSEHIKIILLLAAVIITVCNLVSKQVRGTFDSIFGEYWNLHKGETQNNNFTHVGKWYYYVYHNLTELQAHEFIIFIFIVTNTVGLFVLASALISLTNFAFLVLLNAMRIKKLSTK
jgi:phosphatidylglycerophosphate synthase